MRRVQASCKWGYNALGKINPSWCEAGTWKTRQERRDLMTESTRDRVLKSLLWGGVAAAGQYTMLFLSIVRRIHVRFEGAPIFWVDPSGPIALTKDSALTSVWVMTVAYGLLAVAIACRRPRPTRRAWTGIALLALALAVIAALAEPLWGLVVVADLLFLAPALSSWASRWGLS